MTRRIREAIVDGDLAVGKPLPSERDLCASFGVSRASVRESMRTLEAQGLISLGSGGRWSAVVADDLSAPLQQTFTHLLRLERIRPVDLVELRIAIETHALRNAARHGRPRALDRARAAVERMQSCLTERDELAVDEFHEADVEFHVALVAASGNEAMHWVMLAVRQAMARYLLEALQKLEDPRVQFRQSQQEHIRILRTLEAGDGPRAAALVVDHINDFYVKHYA